MSTAHNTVCAAGYFGISPVCAGGSDWWNQRGVIWPWPYLDSWKAGGEKSPLAEITTWHIYVGVIPFVLIQMLALVVLWYVPGLATALPHLLYGGR